MDRASEYASAPVATVFIDGDAFQLSRERPFVFGREDAEGVIGLHRGDMGVSAEAGSVEWAWNVWWVINRSRKRQLLMDAGGGGLPHRLACGQRFAVAAAPMSVLVPGEIFTYRLEVVIPETQLAVYRSKRDSSGTLGAGQITLNEKDIDVLVALFSPYLEDYPRRQAQPLTYKEAAKILGEPWTGTKVRKQVERVRDRLARHGTYFEGEHARYDLADYLVYSGLLSPADLRRLPGRQ